MTSHCEPIRKQRGRGSNKRGVATVQTRRHAVEPFNKHHGGRAAIRWPAAGHLVRAGEGGAERPDLRWAEPARSVEWERMSTGRSAIARWSADRERL